MSFYQRGPPLCQKALYGAATALEEVAVAAKADDNILRVVGNYLLQHVVGANYFCVKHEPPYL